MRQTFTTGKLITTCQCFARWLVIRRFLSTKSLSANSACIIFQRACSPWVTSYSPDLTSRTHRSRLPDLRADPLHSRRAFAGRQCREVAQDAACIRSARSVRHRSRGIQLQARFVHIVSRHDRALKRHPILPDNQPWHRPYPCLKLKGQYPCQTFRPYQIPTLLGQETRHVPNRNKFLRFRHAERDKGIRMAMHHCNHILTPL